jgi:hypothetical protein
MGRGFTTGFLARFRFPKAGGWATVVLATIGTAWGGPARAEPIGEQQPTFYLGGTQVHEKDHDRWADTLSAIGMNTVAVTVYAKQGDWDTDHLWFDDEAPSVVDEIRAAKAKGLAVVLVLRIAIDHAFERNKFVWHGMIMPRSDALIRSWFDRYTKFAAQWARIAQAEGVDLLGIGSELNSMTATLPITRVGNLMNYHGHNWYEKLYRRRAKHFAHEIEERHLWVRGFDNYETLEGYLDDRYRTKKGWAKQAYLRPGNHTLRRINERRALIHNEWNELIDAVRAEYDGRLTYAANFDAYQDVAFWDRLDVMGINAYFQLKPNIDDSLDEEQMLALFTRKWEGILNRMAQFQKKHGVATTPIVFTELGYTFRKHSTVEPWAHAGFSVVGWKGHDRRLVVWGEQPVDYDERRVALEGLRAARLNTEAKLTGILYWKLSTDAAHEAIEPFVLHIGPDSTDELQDVLVGFLPGQQAARR